MKKSIITKFKVFLRKLILFEYEISIFIVKSIYYTYLLKNNQEDKDKN